MRERECIRCFVLILAQDQTNQQSMSHHLWKMLKCIDTGLGRLVGYGELFTKARALFPGSGSGGGNDSGRSEEKAGSSSFRDHSLPSLPLQNVGLDRQSLSGSSSFHEHSPHSLSLHIQNVGLQLGTIVAINQMVRQSLWGSSSFHDDSPHSLPLHIQNLGLQLGIIDAFNPMVRQSLSGSSSFRDHSPLLIRDDDVLGLASAQCHHQFLWRLNGRSMFA